MDFKAELEVYQCNAWPGILQNLSNELNVSVKSLQQLGIGWRIEDGCFVIPERDATGNIIGLTRRWTGGKKAAITGSKRGLVYPLAEGFVLGTRTYAPGRHNWTRVSQDAPCPICDKPDWCLVSSVNPANPPAVICGRISKGAQCELEESGFLHIRRKEGEVSKDSHPLPSNKHPVIIVEGMSDTATALDLGFIAVGRPNSRSCLGMVADLVQNRQVVVIGENDAPHPRTGMIEGIEGMERAFEAVKSVTKRTVKILPPEGAKDLRAWRIQHDLSAKDLLEAIDHGEETTSGNVLPNDDPLMIAGRWLKDYYYYEEMPVLRRMKGCWYWYDGECYREVEEEVAVRGCIYEFLQGKLYCRMKGDVPVIEPYKVSRVKVNNIIDALSLECPIEGDPPCWLDDCEKDSSENFSDPTNLICYSNGILNVSTKQLIAATPQFFTLAALPYRYVPTAKCPLWKWFLNDVFLGNQEKIDLLQEWFGYNLLPDTSMEKFMLFVGRPRSGKGTVLNTLQAVLGREQVASTNFGALCGSFGFQPLVNKLAVIMPDAHIPHHLDGVMALETIKTITGQDPVSINRKHLPALANHHLSCRFSIAVNDLPDFPDYARAIRSRVCLIHFARTYEGQEDFSLKKRLEAEAPGIAIWALEGLSRLRAQGKFTEPESSLPVLADWQRVMNPLTDFVAGFCEFDQSFHVAKRELFQAWREWAKENNIKIGSQAAFGRRVRTMYPHLIGVGRRRPVNPVGTDPPQIWTYEGVKLNDEAHRLYLGRPR